MDPQAIADGIKRRFSAAEISAMESNSNETVLGLAMYVGKTIRSRDGKCKARIIEFLGPKIDHNDGGKIMPSLKVKIGNKERKATFSEFYRPPHSP